MSSISMALAAARQAAALGAYGQTPQAPARSQVGGPAAAEPVTPAKPPGTGLLIDTRA